MSENHIAQGGDSPLLFVKLQLFEMCLVLGLSEGNQLHYESKSPGNYKYSS